MTSPDDTETALLEAVRAEVAAVGARRITVAGVARRAGLSRMTVYRRAGNVQQLVLDALAQEFRVVLAQADGAAGIGRARIVTVALQVVHSLQHSALLHKLHQDDPDLLLPYLLDHFGRGQLTLVTRLAELVADGQRDGSVRAGDPELLSRMLIIALQGFVFAPDMIDADTVDADLTDTEATSDPLAAQVDHELERLIDGYLGPIVR